MSKRWPKVKMAAGKKYVDEPLSQTWNLGSKLGEGSFAIVRLVESVQNAKIKAAVKIITKDAEKEDCEKNIVREILSYKLAAASKHPNIVQMYGVYEDDVSVFIIMELLRGGEIFDRHKIFPEPRVAVLAKSMLSALAHIHKIGVTHRDITPHNFLFKGKDPDSPLKLTDFGISYVDEQQEAALRTACGTPKHIAPEVVKCQPYDSRADVWSLGTIIYQMFVGYSPYDYGGENQLAVLRKVKYDKVKYVDNEWDQFSPEAKTFVEWLLTREFKKRPTSVEALSHPFIKKYFPEDDVEVTAVASVEASPPAEEDPAPDADEPASPVNTPADAPAPAPPAPAAAASPATPTTSASADPPVAAPPAAAPPAVEKEAKAVSPTAAAAATAAVISPTEEVDASPASGDLKSPKSPVATAESPVSPPPPSDPEQESSSKRLGLRKKDKAEKDRSPKSGLHDSFSKEKDKSDMNESFTKKDSGSAAKKPSTERSEMSVSFTKKKASDASSPLFDAVPTAKLDNNPLAPADPGSQKRFVKKSVTEPWQTDANGEVIEKPTEKVKKTKKKTKPSLDTNDIEDSETAGRIVARRQTNAGPLSPKLAGAADRSDRGEREKPAFDTVADVVSPRKAKAKGANRFASMRVTSPRMDMAPALATQDDTSKYGAQVDPTAKKNFRNVLKIFDKK